MPEKGSCREEQEREVTEGQNETFRGDRYVCYLDLGSSFTGVYIC